MKKNDQMPILPIWKKLDSVLVLESKVEYVNVISE